VDHAIEVADRRPPQVEVLDRASDTREAHDVALAELVLDEDQRAVQVVADEGLRPEPDGDPDHAEPRHGRSDVQAELAQHHEPRDDDDECLDDAGAKVVEGVHAALELHRAQFLGRTLRGLTVD
jgi:hypothetical protein